jgi:hypothetical protein
MAIGPVMSKVALRQGFCLVFQLSHVISHSTNIFLPFFYLSGLMQLVRFSTHNTTVLILNQGNKQHFVPRAGGGDRRFVCALKFNLLNDTSKDGHEYTE